MDTDFLAILLVSSVALHLIMIVVSMVFIRAVKRDQRRRQKVLLEQAKINTVLQETLDMKDEVIKNYKDIIDHRH